MAAKLFVRPNEPPLTWNQFCREAPPFAVAIDGYVGEAPCFDPQGPRVNFNHHEGVSRLETRATCAQVLLAIRQGFFTRFRNHEEGICANVFANDCDQDVCTTWFLINNSHLVASTMNPLINRLVFMEDMMDSTAGAYPVPQDLPFLQELAWVFEPYTRLVTTGGLGRRNADEFSGVVFDVEHRIMDHITGKGKFIPLDTRYNVIGGGSGWNMVQEIGQQAKTGMFHNGITAYVSVRERPDGRHTYTIGRIATYVPFDVPRLLQALDDAEGSTEHWGGSDTVGGSPRASGSRLDPTEVVRIVNDNLPNE